MYPSATLCEALLVNIVESIGTGPLSTRPGAANSGLRKPSCVDPQADHGAAKSSVGVTVPLVSEAPTVITNGSFAGANPTPLSAPSTA